jgi:hypothetical protein
MAALDQLYGIARSEAESLSPRAVESLLQSAYQAYVSVAGRDPGYQAFLDMANSSGASLGDRLRPRLTEALQNVRAGRF